MVVTSRKGNGVAVHKYSVAKFRIKMIIKNILLPDMEQ